MPTVPTESRLAQAPKGPVDAWAGVGAVTRFHIGARSPDHNAPAARLLASAMPHAEVEMVPRLGHGPAVRATMSSMDSLIRFLR